jgi:hypothetical protein
LTNFIKIGLGAAIAIIFPLMVGLGVEAFYTSPKSAWDQCIDKLPRYDEKTGQIPEQDPTYRACLEEKEGPINEHNRNVFIITTLIGFLAIAAGSLLYREEIAPVMPGLIFGGIITIFYGTIRGFEAVDKRWLFLELVVLLAGIVGVTWRYLKISHDYSKKK